MKFVYTQKNSNVFAYMLWLIYDIYIYIMKTWFNFCAYTDRCDAVNRLIFAFSDWFTRSAITHRAVTALYSHVKLIYNIHTYITKARLSFCTHTHQCDAVNRSIFDFLIDLHESQIHTLRRHDTVFAHIYRTTATSLRTCCNSYASHTHTLRRHDSAFAHLHVCMMQ